MKMSSEFLQALCYWKNLLGIVRYFWSLFNLNCMLICKEFLDF